MQKIWVEHTPADAPIAENIIDVSIHADHRTAHIIVTTPTQYYHVGLDRRTFEAFVARVAAIHADKTAILPLDLDPHRPA